MNDIQYERAQAHGMRGPHVNSKRALWRGLYWQMHPYKPWPVPGARRRVPQSSVARDTYFDITHRWQWQMDSGLRSFSLTRPTARRHTRTGRADGLPTRPHGRGHGTAPESPVHPVLSGTQ